VLRELSPFCHIGRNTGYINDLSINCGVQFFVIKHINELL
jgi:hypothetical protein